MSHYTVAVFTHTGTEEEIESLLAPFDEQLETESHIALTKEKLIERERTDRQRFIDDIEKGFFNNVELFKHMFKPENAKYYYNVLDADTDDKLYDLAVDFYDGEEFDEEGNLLTTYNEDSKWDWYAVGGRWSELLRDGKFHEWTDTVQVRNWQWEAYDEDHPQFEATYAVLLPDGEWLAPGKMGWWGMSSETDEEYEEWRSKWKERFYDCADRNWYVTIVDCHI